MSLNIKVIQPLMEKMEAAGVAYVAAYNAHEKKSAQKELKSAAKAAVDEYNDAVCNETYKVWAAEGEPVKTAIRERFVKGCKKMTFKTNDDDVMVMTIVDTEVKANLPAMHTVIGADKFASPDWFVKTQKLAWLIAGRLNKELGENISFNYQIEDAAKAFAFDDGIKPNTDKGVQVALQQVFDAILFIDNGKGKNQIAVSTGKLDDGKVYSPQWTYIREALTRQGKGVGEIVIGNTVKMSELVADAMHNTLTSGRFMLTSE